MAVYAGVKRGVVELNVVVAARQYVEVAGLEVHEHAAGKGSVRLFDGLVRQYAAGVCARAGDEAHQPVAALLSGVGSPGEQYGGRVVQEHKALAAYTALCQLCGEVSADEPAFKACELHLLRQAEDVAVALRRLLCGVGEAKADLGRSVEQRGDVVSCKGYEILPGDGPVGTGHGADVQRVDDRTRLREANQCGAEVRAAGIDNHGGLPKGQQAVGSEISGYHPE